MVDDVADFREDAAQGLFGINRLHFDWKACPGANSCRIHGAILGSGRDRFYGEVLDAPVA